MDQKEKGISFDFASLYPGTMKSFSFSLSRKTIRIMKIRNIYGKN